MGNNEERQSIALPSIRDWFVTLCEFVTVFAISSSFFTLNDDDDDGVSNNRGGNQHHSSEEDIEELFMKSYLVYWGPSILAASIVLTVAPHVIQSCFKWEWAFLWHPKFPATIQLVKIGGTVSNVYYLVSHADAYDDNMYKLKEVQKLASSGILAGCETVVILNTILLGCCDKGIDRTTRDIGGKINPLPRLSRVWIFFNLWKDFGIVSSFVKTKELYFLLLEFPFPLLLGYIMAYKEISSQKCRYHLLRLVMVAWGGVTLFVSSKMHEDGLLFVNELIVPCSLIACEVVLALCEIKNGRDNAATIAGNAVTATRTTTTCDRSAPSTESEQTVDDDDFYILEASALETSAQFETL